MPCSRTNLTARLRHSVEYRFGFIMRAILPRNDPKENPV